MINRVGATFVNAVREQTGDKAPDIARAYLVARDVFQIRGLWGRVEALDTQVPAAVQTRMLHEIRHLVERGAVWMLRNEKLPLDLAGVSGAYMDGVETLRQSLEAVMSDFDRRNVDRKAEAFEDDGVPQDLARAVASADMLVSGCDVVRLAAQTGQSVNRVAEIYFAIGSHFALDWLREQAAALTAETHWQKMAVSAVVDDLFNHQ